ncbi:MAG: DUF2973 domain-containing protein [Prochlorotrichaceae cyanobacterium]|jgi:hypothetical protein
MLQVLYLIIFAILTVIAVTNLFRNLMMVASDSRRSLSGPQRQSIAPHPELFDSSGKVVNEPLMVMRSASVEDIRDRLDALYDSSPGGQVKEDEG